MLVSKLQSKASKLQQLTMISFVTFARCIEQSLNSSKTKFAGLYNSFLHLLHVLILRVNPFWIELSYYLIFSLVGYFALKVSNPKNAPFQPADFDIFFMSVSAVTDSSTSTVEMEVFSNAQLVLLIILMFAGGEVFTSLLGLHLMKFKSSQNQGKENKVDSCSINSDILNSIPPVILDQIELAVVFQDEQFIIDDQKPHTNQEIGRRTLDCQDKLNKNCIQILANVVLCYLLVVQLFGFSLITIYISTVPSAREVLKKKGINLPTFSAFATVSSFANCGFLPTNENMMVFKKNSGLLLILIPQILIGNTLYPPCLRLIIWILQKITKREEFTFMLKNSRTLGYNHLPSGVHSIFLAMTVLGFMILQLLLFSILEWNSDSTAGLSAFQKLISSLFQVVNSRHAGESVFDLSLICPAMLVLFVLMMYLPPYTSLVPINEDSGNDNDPISKGKIRSQRRDILHCLMFSQSQLTCLIIFIILICITERDKMKKDPLNFNLMSIVVEVIGAYGNVGFSMGYSCQRQSKPDGSCKDASYGLGGRWSSKGKFILIIIMFFGKLKKFKEKAGKAWGAEL